MQVIKNTKKTDIEAFSIQYVNSVGAIIDNRLLLHSKSHPMIEIESIVKAEIHKTRNSIYNLIFIVLTIPFFYTLFSYNLSKIGRILICIYILLLLFFGFFYKKQQYVMFIRKINKDNVELEINKYRKEEAKSMVRYINRRVKQLKKISA